MFFFKNKAAEPAKPSAQAAPVSKPQPNINPDDFFKDMGRKPKEKDMSIEAPEITGLRESPLPPPGSTINNIATDDSMTDTLIDKTLLDDGEIHGNISVVDLSAIDTSSLDRKESADKENEEQQGFVIPSDKPPHKIDADDFFKNMGRKAKPKDTIEVPEVTGLRDAPLPAPVSTIGGVDTDESMTDNLIDKTAVIDNSEHGIFKGIDSDTIDVSVLRE